MNFCMWSAFPLRRWSTAVMDGEIEDAKTVAAVLKAKVLLNL